MSNRLVFEGLSELRAALRSLPAELAREASNIVTAAANGAAVEIRTGYGNHRVSGGLQDGVEVVRLETGKAASGVLVINKSKIANIFENGTQARHTSLGANRGTMPPGHVFVPAMIRARRSMYGKLRDLLVRHGLSVSGDA